MPLSKLKLLGLNSYEKISDSKHWVIENITSGLCVYNHKGSVFVVSANPRIIKLILEHRLNTPSNEVTKEKLDRFFNAVGELRYLFARDLKPTGSANQLDPESLANLILSHKKPVYIKSSRTAGGTCVVRVSRDQDGNPVIECDGAELDQLVSQRLNSLTNWRNLGARTQISRAAKALTPDKILARLIEMMESPIIEEEIPMALCDGGRAEPRIIYQQNSNGELERQGAYCKKSESQVTANVTLGGSGISVEDALRGVLISKVATENLDSEVKSAQKRLFELCDREAKNLHTKAPAIFRDFALDIGLVWNQETSQLDFYLIEVQNGYACTGLLDVDRDAYARVAANKNRIAEDLPTRRDKLRSMLYLHLDEQADSHDTSE